MAWTKEQLMGHKNAKTLTRGVDLKGLVRDTKAVEPEPEPKKTGDSAAGGCKARTFTIPGPVIAKPRMTARDKWKKRPVVLRYHDFCDRIRAVAGDVGEPDGIEVVAHLPVCPSWSEKEKRRLIGRPHRDKPDASNILKGVEDALVKRDQALWAVSAMKYWCAPVDERVEVTVLYAV